MSEPVILNTINQFPGDGSTVNWNINFAGGYLSKSHVKYQITDAVGTILSGGVLTDSFIGANQVTVSPAVPVGQNLSIYRDTPKVLPLVDFTDGAIVNEANLDKIAQQAVFVSAEMVDRFGASVTNIADAADSANAAGTAAANAAASALAAVDAAATAIAAANAAVAAAEATNEGLIEDVNAAIATSNDAAAALQDRVDALDAATWMYDVTLTTPEAPADGAKLVNFKPNLALTLPANLTGSNLIADVAATSSSVFSIQKNGVQVATITVDAADTTGTLSTQAAVAFSATDKLTIVAPAPADATLAAVGITLHLEIV